MHLKENEKISGFATYGKDELMKPYEYLPRPLGEKDVEIKIVCCGICHSDIHTIDSEWGPLSSYPLIVGHEIVGKVVAKGKQVDGLNIGDRVGVGAQCWSCLDCHECKTKTDNLCSRRVFTYNQKYEDGLPAQGGYAQYVRVQQEWAFKIPAEITDEEAAPLLCAGVTVYAPLKRHGVQKGISCGIVGIGGLGHLAVQFAAKMGATVTAISTSAAKEEEAKKMGASHFLNTKIPAQVQAAKSTLDVILCTAAGGVEGIFEFMDYLRPGGKLIIVGVPEGELKMYPFQLIGSQKTVCGSLIGSISEVHETLSFAAAHNVRPWIKTLEMKQVNEGLDLVRKNQVKYRVVLKN